MTASLGTPTGAQTKLLANWGKKGPDVLAFKLLSWSLYFAPSKDKKFSLVFKYRWCAFLIWNGFWSAGPV